MSASTPPADSAPSQPIQGSFRGLPETPTRATSGMKVGEHAGQTHHAMDALLTKELKDFRLKTPLESFSSLLGYPREGVAKHKDTVALASLPAITGAYHSLKKAADSCKTEHQLYQPLSNLLNAICEAPLLSSTPLRRGSPSRSPSPPLSPASSTSSPEDDLGLSFIVSAHAKITEKKVPRTPDLAMIIHHGDSPSDVPSYADILIPIEVKGPNNSEDVEHQVADQARAVLAAQCDRNFALCLSITFMAKTRFLECRLWYFDRSGSISSEGFNIFRERRPFIWLVRRLTDLIDPEMGFDQTLKHLGPPVGPESHQEFVTTIMDEKMGPVEVTTDRVLWNTRSIRGRATRCFGAIVGSAPCILKLAWQDPARRPKEVKFYQWIEEYNIDAGVAHYLAYDEGIRTSELRRGVGGRSGDNYVFEDRVLCRLVLSTVGRSLEDYATLKELFGAIHDCITAHRKLVECPKKILHRDISVNNILLPDEASPPVGHRGFLIDFDYAKSLADDSDSEDTVGLDSSSSAENSSNLDGSSQAKRCAAEKHQHRTGTMPFMAYGVLAGNTTHTFKHDLESFFWVLLYLLLLPTEANSEHAEMAALDLEHLFETNLIWAEINKAGLLDERQNLRINPKYSVVAPFMEELKLLIKEEWAVVQGQRTGAQGLTYDRMLDILNRALGALEGNNPRRASPISWQRLLPKTGTKRSRNFASSPSNATLDHPGVEEESRPAKKKKGSRK